MNFNSKSTISTTGAAATPSNNNGQQQSTPTTFDIQQTLQNLNQLNQSNAALPTNQNVQITSMNIQQFQQQQQQLAAIQQLFNPMQFYQIQQQQQQQLQQNLQQQINPQSQQKSQVPLSLTQKVQTNGSVQQQQLLLQQQLPQQQQTQIFLQAAMPQPSVSQQNTISINPTSQSPTPIMNLIHQQQLQQQQQKANQIAQQIALAGNTRITPVKRPNVATQNLLKTQSTPQSTAAQQQNKQVPFTQKSQTQQLAVASQLLKKPAIAIQASVAAPHPPTAAVISTKSINISTTLTNTTIAKPLLSGSKPSIATITASANTTLIGDCTIQKLPANTAGGSLSSLQSPTALQSTTLTVVAAANKIPNQLPIAKDNMNNVNHNNNNHNNNNNNNTNNKNTVNSTSKEVIPSDTTNNKIQSTPLTTTTTPTTPVTFTAAVAAVPETKNAGNKTEKIEKLPNANEIKSTENIINTDDKIDPPKESPVKIVVPKKVIPEQSTLSAPTIIIPSTVTTSSTSITPSTLSTTSPSSTAATLPTTPIKNNTVVTVPGNSDQTPKAPRTKQSPRKNISPLKATAIKNESIIPQTGNNIGATVAVVLPAAVTAAVTTTTTTTINTTDSVNSSESVVLPVVKIAQTKMDVNGASTTITAINAADKRIESIPIVAEKIIPAVKAIDNKSEQNKAKPTTIKKITVAKNIPSKSNEIVSKAKTEKLTTVGVRKEILSSSPSATSTNQSIASVSPAAVTAVQAVTAASTATTPTVTTTKNRIRSKTETTTPLSTDTTKNHSSIDQKRPKRSKLSTKLFQSPLPEFALATKLSVNEQHQQQLLQKGVNSDDRLTLFYKGEFIAVRNAEGSFFLCQTLQNIFKQSPQIRIRWLTENEKDMYSGDYYDKTDIDCILTSVQLEKLDKNSYRLPEGERVRILTILKRAIDVESGVLPKPTPSFNSPDGLDLSLYTNEAQIQKSLGRKRKINTDRGITEPTEDVSSGGDGDVFVDGGGGGNSRRGRGRGSKREGGKLKSKNVKKRKRSLISKMGADDDDDIDEDDTEDKSYHPSIKNILKSGTNALLRSQTFPRKPQKVSQLSSSLSSSPPEVTPQQPKQQQQQQPQQQQQKQPSTSSTADRITTIGNNSKINETITVATRKNKVQTDLKEPTAPISSASLQSRSQDIVNKDAAGTSIANVKKNVKSPILKSDPIVTAGIKNKTLKSPSKAIVRNENLPDKLKAENTDTKTVAIAIDQLNSLKNNTKPKDGASKSNSTNTSIESTAESDSKKSPASGKITTTTTVAAAAAAALTNTTATATAIRKQRSTAKSSVTVPVAISTNEEEALKKLNIKKLNTKVMAKDKTSQEDTVKDVEKQQSPTKPSPTKPSPIKPSPTKPSEKVATPIIAATKDSTGDDKKQIIKPIVNKKSPKTVISNKIGNKRQASELDNDSNIKNKNDNKVKDHENDDDHDVHNDDDDDDDEEQFLAITKKNLVKRKKI